ncbi:hypothetical protein TSAR_009543, partial [Trichomalopsis sarcophagae]
FTDKEVLGLSIDRRSGEPIRHQYSSLTSRRTNAMSSKTLVLVILASLALSQAIAIGKPTNQLEGTTTRVVKANANDGFTLQSGFEGYVASPQKTAVSSSGSSFKWIATTLAKLKLLKSLLIPISGALLVYGVKIVAHLGLSMLLGVVATTAVCAFTPICSFSLSLPGLDIFKGKSVKERVAEYARDYMTKENMEMLSLIVQSALNKYGTGQLREEEQPATESTTTPNGTSQDEIDDFVPYQGERSNIFDWNLLQNLAKSNRGNLLVSPISLKLALVLLYEGAQDETAQQLATVMHLPVGILATRDKFSSVLKSLQTRRPEYALNVGTRIFLDQSITPRQRYGAILKTFYNTDIVSLNFGNAKTSAELINDYVRNVTQARVQKLVEDESKLRNSMMLIASAMYFQGTWLRQPFSVNQTQIGKFRLGDGKNTVQVPFMRSNGKFYYAYSSDLEAKILRLPYAGRKLAMYAILPQAPGKLDELVKKVSPFVINRHVWLMQELYVDVMLPKFKFDFTSKLENNLRELGIRDIFDDTATLTGILRSKSTSRRLVVTDVIQKTGIEVSERGTVAYAATEIDIGNKMNDETFQADQPFLFYIEDESTGTILYMGLVNNPLEETGISESSAAPQMPSRVGGHEDAPTAPSAIGTGVDERQNFFNVELLQELNEAKPGNVVIGTSSVKAALMILAEAAGGRTRQQIVSTLRLPSDVAQIRDVVSQSISSFKDPKSNTVLQTAIKMWLSKDVALHKDYTDILQRYYKGELQATNFADVAGTVKTINDWAKKCTNGHISSILEPNSVAADTKMVLTTAVYFKGTWLHSFDKTATRSRCFNVPKLGCQQVPLMEVVENYKYNYVPALDAQVIQIPYTGERVSMVVLLPQRLGEQALLDLSRDLAFTPVSVLLSSLQKTEVLLQLPRFGIGNKVDLRATLEKLGIKDLFDENANLTTAFPRGNVQVGAVMHNAQIQVNEEGTIAAAVSGVSVIPLMGSTVTTFRADRPFLFFLVDHQTNSILFAGRYVQPEGTRSA